MSALEKMKKMSSQDVLDLIKESGIEEYGLYKQPLFDRLMAAKAESEEEKKEPGVIAALNNADTDRVLLAVLRQNPKRVMEGICIAAHALGTEKKVLHLPEEETELLEGMKETAEKYGVELIAGIVNVRAAKGCALLHLVTVKNLADFLDGCYEKGTYVSVNGNEIKKVKDDTKIVDLLKKEGVTDGIKAFVYGYEFHTVKEAEKTLGEAGITNGLIRVLTEKDCIVQETEKTLLASKKTSCGKCVFCREGLIQLEHMQKEITEGRGKNGSIDLTKEIGEAMCYSTPCSMGHVSSRIALTATDLFEDEYEAHIKKKKCPAGKCSAFINLYIDPTLCNGCGECIDVCPKDCIEGKPKYIHMIDDFDCTKCGKCIPVCEEEAIIKTTGKLPKLPTKLTKVGKFRKR